MSRALAPVVGTLLLVGITVGLATVLGTVALGVSPPTDISFVVLEAAADGDTNRITLTNRGGSTLQVESIELRISINGTPLAHQPPIPFFSAVGFRAGPTGPFNIAADPEWDPDESASIRVANSNSPQLRTGSRITVQLYQNGILIAERRIIAR